MILKYGSSSNSKQAVRAYLLLMGFELGDKFTVELKTATKNFQKENSLKVDGIAGPETFACLCKKLPEVKYKDYSGSVYVKAVQALVGTTIDGKYGKNTKANVVAFQTTAKLEATGDIALNDWLALFGCSYVKTAGSAATQEETVVPVTGGGTNTVQPVDYKQGDKRWKNIPYTIIGSSSQTIGSSGCGPTSMADIMATWIDKAVTPVEMCAYAIKHGFRTKNSGTAWGFFQSIAKAYGFTGFVQTKSMATCRNAIKAGAFVVASMGPGYWTSGGHYICLWKTDDTYMYANDPASSSRKKQKLGAFEEQRKQFFIFYKPDKEAGTDPFDGAGGAEDDSAAGKEIIDVSRHQGVINWDKLSPKLKFVLIKASGLYKNGADSQYANNVKGAVSHGVAFHVYHFLYCTTEAEAKRDAKLFYSTVAAQGYMPKFWVLDCEKEWGVASNKAKAIAEIFEAELRRLAGEDIKVAIYIGHNVYKPYALDYDHYAYRWIPRYGSNDGTIKGSIEPDFPCDLWQYTSAGKIDGINGNVDLNVLTGTKPLKFFLGGDA